MLKQAARSFLRTLGYEVARTPAAPIAAADGAQADAEFYRPLFSPWLGFGAFADAYALAQPLTLAF